MTVRFMIKNQKQSRESCFEMIGESNFCYPNVPQGLPVMYPLVSIDQASSSASETHTNSLLSSLSLLKEKIHQVQSLASIFLAPDHDGQNPESVSVALPTMGTLIQEIIVTASSMMFTCQQMSLEAHNSANIIPDNELQAHHVNKLADNPLSIPPDDHGNHNRLASVVEAIREQGSYQEAPVGWHGDNFKNLGSPSSVSNNDEEGSKDFPFPGEIDLVKIQGSSSAARYNYDIVELDASDILAKYTHYCQVCGKGFKRDANLRMHMRAHGDEYKSSAALSNPMKNKRLVGHDNDNSDGSQNLIKKYSCPQEGCRWNRKHAKFQPLKSMICVKNHYKRSHCPKMYVCKRCNRKRFSVLSDLRTHEKHCGDLKWQCSCGTTFSRKDKLMGHVTLFVGHTPLITKHFIKMGKYADQSYGSVLSDDTR